MAGVFPVRCRFPGDARLRLEVLGDYMNVLVGAAGSGSAAFVAWSIFRPGRVIFGDELCGLCRYPNPTGLSC
jgi:hypothetical protein